MAPQADACLTPIPPAPSSGRTQVLHSVVVTHLEQLRAFCDAAEAVAGVHPSCIYVLPTLEIQMVGTTVSDGGKVYDINWKAAGQTIPDGMEEAEAAADAIADAIANFRRWEDVR